MSNYVFKLFKQHINKDLTKHLSFPPAPPPPPQYFNTPSSLSDEKGKDDVFTETARDETRYNSLESLSETVCSNNTAVPAQDSNGEF